MNVGPTGDGRIPPIFEERLRQFGTWMKVNGESIYGTVPWTHQNDNLTTGVWYLISSYSYCTKIKLLILCMLIGRK